MCSVPAPKAAVRKNGGKKAARNIVEATAARDVIDSSGNLACTLGTPFLGCQYVAMLLRNRWPVVTLPGILNSGSGQ